METNKRLSTSIFFLNVVKYFISVALLKINDVNDELSLESIITCHIGFVLKLL